MSHKRAPHTITLHACATAFNVSPEQVQQWAQQGNLNSARGLNGDLRIHVDATYRALKKTWLERAPSAAPTS